MELKIDQRMTRMDHRMNQMNQKVATLNTIEKKLDRLTTNMIISVTSSILSARYVAGMETDLNQILRRIERLEEHTQIEL